MSCFCNVVWITVKNRHTPPPADTSPVVQVMWFSWIQDYQRSLTVKQHNKLHIIWDLTGALAVFTPLVQSTVTGHYLTLFQSSSYPQNWLIKLALKLSSYVRFYFLKTFSNTGCMFSSCLTTAAKLPAHRKVTNILPYQRSKKLHYEVNLRQNILFFTCLNARNAVWHKRRR
jgi:hypothetical protein